MEKGNQTPVTSYYRNRRRVVSHTVGKELVKSSVNNVVAEKKTVQIKVKETPAPSKPRTTRSSARKVTKRTAGTSLIKDYFQVAPTTTKVAQKRHLSNDDGESANKVAKKTEEVVADAAPVDKSKISSYLVSKKLDLATEPKKSSGLLEVEAEPEKSTKETLPQSPIKPRMENQSSPATPVKPQTIKKIEFGNVVETQSELKKEKSQKQLENENNSSSYGVQKSAVKINGKVDVKTTDSAAKIEKNVKATGTSTAEPESYLVPKGLELPTSYKVLLSQFHCLDTVVRFLFNRGEKATWHKIEKSVNTMTSRTTSVTFTKKSLGQIRTIYPDAFEYKMMKGTLYEPGRTIQENYHLVLDLIIDERDTFGGEKKITSAAVTRRLQKFQYKLVELVKVQHKVFLKEKFPSMSTSAIEDLSGKIKQWQRTFRLEDVTEIAVAELPSIPENKRVDDATARKNFNDAKIRLTQKYDLLTKKLEKHRESLTKKAEVEKKSGDAEASTSTAAAVAPKVDPLAKAKSIHGGKYAALYEKILKKEQLNSVRLMVRNDAKSKELQSLRNLPEVAHSLRTLYTTQNKTSLQMNFICKKLLLSSRNISTIMSMESHIQLLATHTNKWLKIVPLRDLQYVKMDKTRILKDIKDELNLLVKRTESES